MNYCELFTVNIITEFLLSLNQSEILNKKIYLPQKIPKLYRYLVPERAVEHTCRTGHARPGLGHAVACSATSCGLPATYAVLSLRLPVLSKLLKATATEMVASKDPTQAVNTTTYNFTVAN